MKTLRGWITTTCLAIVLLTTTTTADGGIIFGGSSLNQPSGTTCNDVTIEKTQTVDSTIGIIFGGLFGIIFGGDSLSRNPEVNCGIIFGGN